MANLISSHFHVSLEKASGPLGDAASKWQRYVNEITSFADAIIPPSVGARATSGRKTNGRKPLQIRLG